MKGYEQLTNPKSLFPTASTVDFILQTHFLLPDATGTIT